jgi:hypothetical protein
VISATFVSGFNETRCFHIIDSSGCLLPTEVCFTVPDPGPVNLTVIEQDSCPNVATGSVSVLSDQNIFCKWTAVGTILPQIQGCTLNALPATTFLTVTATTIIGCTASAVVRIATRTALAITLVDRTTVGQLGGACVDNITLMISGGSLGPPYYFTLFNDATNATVQSFANGTLIFISNVCRSVLYTAIAMEHDHMCPVTLIVNDPEFTFGSSVAGLIGLPPPNPLLFLPRSPRVLPVYTTPKLHWAVGAAIVGFVALIMIFIGFILWTPASRGGNMNKPLLRKGAQKQRNQ